MILVCLVGNKLKKVIQNQLCNAWTPCTTFHFNHILIWIQRIRQTVFWISIFYISNFWCLSFLYVNDKNEKTINQTLLNFPLYYRGIKCNLFSEMRVFVKYVYNSILWETAVSQCYLCTRYTLVWENITKAINIPLKICTHRDFLIFNTLSLIPVK